VTQLLLRDLTVSEGDTVVQVPLRLSAPSDSVITVDVFTADGSGSDFSDLDGISTTVTFAPGETLIEVPLSLFDDDNVEGRETVELRVDPGESAVRVPQTRSIIEIVDNDGDQVTAPNLVVEPLRVSESDEVAAFALRLNAPSNQSTSVDVSTVAGTATAGSDFAAVSQETVTFAPGDTAQTVEVDLFDDAVAEGAESFALALSNPVNATLLTERATATIAASDQTRVATPTLLLEDVTVSEGDTVVQVPLRLSAPSDSVITVDVFTADGSGSDFSDLDGISTTVTFAPGETLIEVPLSLFDDDNVEGRETVELRVDPGESAVRVPQTRSIIEIVDNDGDQVTAPNLVVVRDGCWTPRNGRQAATGMSLSAMASSC
jgi:hypothetical protein